MIFLQNLKNFLKEHISGHVTSRVALIVVTGCCLVTLFFQYFNREDAVPYTEVIGSIVVPFQKGVNDIGSFLFKTEQDRISLEEAKEEISRLESMLADANSKVYELNGIAIENRELRKLLEAKEKLGSYEVMAAEIIGNDGANAFYRFTINRGSLDGIQVYMNVVNADGLIGYVTEVGLNYAVVTTIIEDKISVSAMTRNGMENCIVTGTLESAKTGLLKLSNGLADTDFGADSTLVTSNISDRYLPNLLIGYAKDVALNADGLTQSGYVETAVDFFRLNYVLVITTMKEELKEDKK